MRGEIVSADGQLDIQNIGEREDALLCVTPFKDCCKVKKRGEFYNIRDGAALTVPKRGENKSLYRNRGPSVVRLNRRKSGEDVVGDIAGLYRCCMPDGCGDEKCIEITLFE